VTVIAALLAAEHDLTFLHGCTAKDGPGEWTIDHSKTLAAIADALSAIGVSTDTCRECDRKETQDMSIDKLTRRQNELISEALCAVAIDRCTHQGMPETLKTLRRALVSEMEAVTRETGRSEGLRGVRSIDG